MKNLLFAVVVLGACDAASPPSLATVPKIVTNSLSPAALLDTALTTGVLDASGAAAMAPTADARVVLSYAVGCALDATQSVTYKVDGADYTATGSAGIAPGWTTDGLSATDAAWVSACVFSRVNLFGAVVELSDRGAIAVLAASPAEQAQYQIDEGAFWGNAFIDLGALDPYSCEGDDQAADDTQGDLPVRKCAQSDGAAGSDLSPCGMHFAGLCSDACATAGAYAGCAFHGGAPVAAVVTTFLDGTPR